MTFNDLLSDNGLFCDGDWIEKKDQDVNGLVRLIQLADIGICEFKDKSNKYITEQTAQNLNCTYLKKGDILIARLPEPLGRACIFPYDGKFITAVDVAILRPANDKVNNQYIMYLINSPQFRKQIKKFESGTTRKRISRKNLDRIDFKIPDYQDQHRIVTRIEELFSQLDSGIETLKKTKEQLKVYRQAVLKEAFESASSSNSKNLTINDLLTKKKKGMTTGSFGTMLKKHEHQSSGVPVLGIENIGKDGFVDGNKIFVSEEKAKELSAFKVDTDDLIISRSGTVGEICIVPPHMKNALLSTNLMRISLDYDVIRADYFMYLFKSKGVVIDQVKELCKGSTRMFLNQTILKQIIFPVPTLKIQAKIIETIESRLSVCDSIEKTIDTALQEAEALRQSILKQAFEGGL